MGSFGERLRRERELRGITIEEIAEATKIGSRSLRALEDEKFDRLPGGIFNKGFVRAYTRYLGIDEEQAVSDYMNAEAQFRAAPAEGAEALAVAAAPSHASRVVPVAIVVIVAAALGLAAWWYWGTRGRARPSTQPAATAPVKPPTSAAPAATAPGGTTEPAQSPAVTPAGQPPASAEKPPLAATQAPPPAASATQAPAVTSEQRGSPDDRFVVQLHAREDSWVWVKADGNPAVSEIMKGASDRSLRARDRLEVKLGNAAGVEVSYNGKLQEIAAAPKQVKTLVFTPQGLQREAASQH